MGTLAKGVAQARRWGLAPRAAAEKFEKQLERVVAR